MQILVDSLAGLVIAFVSVFLGWFVMKPYILKLVLAALIYIGLGSVVHFTGHGEMFSSPGFIFGGALGAVFGVKRARSLIRRHAENNK